MVRAPYVDENGIRSGAWSRDEDDRLRSYILRYGHWNWRSLPMYAGLARSGKSCRLRWMNYLRPGVKRGNFSQHEHVQILKLHAELGNRWSAMAQEMPGRTDNEIKNYWYGHIAKRSRKGNNQAAKTFQDEEHVIKSDVVETFVLESSEVPCQSSGTISQVEELVSPECVKEAETFVGDDHDPIAEPEPWDFWTKPFTFDTDTYTIEQPEVMNFWTELLPLDTYIYSQDSFSPSFFQQEEHFIAVSQCSYNDFSGFTTMA